jgi:hypothetical protein
MKILISESQLKSIISEQRLDKKSNSDKQYFWNKDWTAETMSNIEKQQQQISKAKSTWTYDILNKAVNWWNKWTTNNIVIQKYAKNWGITTNEALRIMGQYREGLKNLTINYTYEPDNNAIAYVVSNNPKVVVVNSLHINDGDPYLIFLHELQHLLSFIKPIHPYQKITDSLGINPKKFLSVFNDLEAATATNVLKVTGKDYYYTSKMKEMGLSVPLQDKYLKSVQLAFPQRKTYIPEPTEVLSRLVIVRKLLGKSESDNITLKEIGDLNNKQDLNKPFEPNIYWLTLSLLFSTENLTNIINDWNLIAKTDIKKPTNIPSNNTMV